MTTSRSVAKAKAAFADCIREAERSSAVVITRHGKPVAALVPASDLDRLARLRGADPEGGLARLSGGWDGSAHLANLVTGQGRTKPRRVPKLG